MRTVAECIARADARHAKRTRLELAHQLRLQGFGHETIRSFYYDRHPHDEKLMAKGTALADVYATAGGNHAMTLEALGIQGPVSDRKSKSKLRRKDAAPARQLEILYLSA